MITQLRLQFTFGELHGPQGALLHDHLMHKSHTPGETDRYLRDKREL